MGRQKSLIIKNKIPIHIKIANFTSSNFNIPIKHEKSNQKIKAFSNCDIIVEEKNKPLANSNKSKLLSLFGDKSFSQFFNEIIYELEKLSESEIKAKVNLMSEEDFFFLYQVKCMAEQMNLSIAEKLKKAMD